ncbi:MAG: patatin-like phospholipase family protein [Clostridia bacterium]|jgi:NTE family protein|nr:patatin-like phospholipase family protein [Clostridia bacterium]MBT7121915.1 patatin-like phospholipase family protein [Clostridia bacterium]
MAILGFGKTKKSGIAFGGGGTRGIAHIGAIKVFQQNNIDFDFIAGTSVGSMAGAVYALGVPWRDMYDYVLTIRKKNLLPPRTWVSYMSAQILERMADYYLEGKTFDQLDKPFCAVAVDLKKGKPTRLNTGNVSKALSASCAIPGVFQPVKIDGKTYVDGGILRVVPTQTVREMGAEKVVGIHLNSAQADGTQSTKRRDVVMTAYKLSINVNAELCEQYSDIMLKPRLNDYMPYSFKYAEEMLKIGEQAALDNLDKIKALLK